MPNWCDNTVTLTHKKPEQLTRVVVAAEREGLFEEFVPHPKNTENVDNSLGWNIDHWGTKWEAQVHSIDLDENSISLSFDTAWGPPIAFYDKMTELGFNVEAKYCELGMDFIGLYENGHDEAYVASESENVPVNLSEYYGLEDHFAELEAELEAADRNSFGNNYRAANYDELEADGNSFGNK